jgi:flagellar biogenesis protein FliO
MHNWEKFPDFVVMMDEMQERKHDSIYPIPQRKNWRVNDGELGEIVTLILGLMGVLKRVGKCFEKRKKAED